MQKQQQAYYLGLDIGTDSVGYAVTDTQYNLLKLHGEPAWGVTLFDEGALNTDRRAFRSARRRLDRRQQRVALLQDLFAKEISGVDARFFIRLRESALYRDEVEDAYPLFCDADYTDQEYHRQYPTIHHLIVDLMRNPAPHDVRLVYLACAWLVAHRGHFLSNLDKNHLAEIKCFQGVYRQFLDYFAGNGYALPWESDNPEAIGEILKQKTSVTQKMRELKKLLFAEEKPPKDAERDFPFSREALLRLLAGGKVKLKDLYQKESYGDTDSVALDLEEEQFQALAGTLGSDFDLLAAMRPLYDWALLTDILGDYATVSEAKVAVYEQHKADLAQLKYFVRRYLPASYKDVFRATDQNNYAAYSYHADAQKPKKKASVEEFSKYLSALFKNVSPDPEDRDAFDAMLSRLEHRTFLPKQKTTDNRVIPHQLYWQELDEILKRAERYLPFLAEQGEDGLTVSEKIRSIFLFRIPYFVGPLNEKSSYAWLERKAGKILPWNFDEMVDLDASEQRFIQRMTNSCTYLPGEPVLPKCSLAYQKFTVLNELNSLRIHGQRLPVAWKQQIYNEVFMRKKSVTRRQLTDYLLANGLIVKGEEDAISGIDEQIHSTLSSAIAFRRLLESGSLTEADVERIIARSAYAEDKSRLARWMAKEYPALPEEDRKYVCSLKLHDFGRLSRAFLCELEGADKETGERFTILQALWETQCNLMELLSDKFTFAEKMETFRREYYAEHALTLSDQMEEMYLSNTVKRQVYRTLDVLRDVTKAFGTPKRIFIEMTRAHSKEEKGKRKASRKQQILELYAKCKEEDVRILRQELEDMGDAADSKLQGDRLFLYYMQLGRCMYTWTPIPLSALGTKQYDVDHIYPQAYVKDDSILNNKVLCLSSVNGEKSNTYPLSDKIRHKMKPYWDYLKEIHAISDEKYKRLTRATPFTDEEKYGFINRQLTETAQSTKAVATLLKARYPETDIVYSKAGLVSEFRQEFELYKSRSFNDLHHAVDAYLNIVVGNVYDRKFNRNWFRVDSDYSIKTRTLFTRPLICDGTVVWDGEAMLRKVKRTAERPRAHLTKYAFFKRGGLFDQLPVAASEGLIPRKQGLPTGKYGGYNKAAILFYIPVQYTAKKKTDLFILSVEMLYGTRFLQDEAFARAYSRDRLERILGKPVDEVTFPLGMRPWKVNTMLSLDGFRVCISGSSNSGKGLILQPMVPFSADPFWQGYMKRLEKFAEKTGDNPAYVYDEAYDKISKAKNEELYELYIEKLERTIYAKRINAPLKILQAGRQRFQALGVKEQAKALLNIQQVFGRTAGGCDLSAIGGGAHAAATNGFSAAVSNWKKHYSDVRLIDCAPSGLWEKRSRNLLELV